MEIRVFGHCAKSSRDVLRLAHLLLAATESFWKTTINQTTIQLKTIHKDLKPEFFNLDL